MTDKALYKLYELKGGLEARTDILANEMAGLKALSDEVGSQYYKGHTRGRVETVKRWRNDTLHSLDLVCKVIEEAENV